MSSLELGFNLNGMIPVSNFSMSSIGKTGMERGKYTYHEWTFELLPEDLEIKEQD